MRNKNRVYGRAHVSCAGPDEKQGREFDRINRMNIVLLIFDPESHVVSIPITLSCNPVLISAHTAAE